MNQRVTLLALGSLLLAGCAARGTPTTAAADLARAGRFVTTGCYRCLQEALAIYEQQLQRDRRPSLALRQAAFDTALLVVLRQKELGIASNAALDRARALATGLPEAPGQVPATVLLDLADLAPGDTSGPDPDEVAARNSRGRRLQLSTIRPQLETPAAPSTLQTYLTLSLDCNDAEARRRLNADDLMTRFGNIPLLRYRIAACGLGARDTFSALRQSDARWVEAAFFEGRAAASARRPNLRAAIDFFGIVQPALPESPSILLALAHAQRGYGDLEPAVASYDGVITMVPRNREALLGRAITLSYLERHREVVETTSRMIEFGTWLMGDAYYWRARSHYVLKALEEAWSDAENAVKLSPTTNVYTLAGVIAYDRKELDTAKDRFERARNADTSNCTAHSYFALVNAAQNDWPLATPVFSQAMTCFTRAAAEAQKELVQVEQSDYDEVYKGRLAAQQRKTIDESTLKAAQAAYNAAQGLLREGKRAEALTHLRLALEHAEVKGQAEALQKLIGR
jgi:tetratricopeptide (TPR) repeat protein